MLNSRSQFLLPALSIAIYNFGLIGGLLARYGLILFFLHILSGTLVILAIPLATSGSATADALLMAAILLWRLRGKVKIDKGMLRLQRWRVYVQKREKTPKLVSGNEQVQLLVVANKESARGPEGVNL